MVGVDPKLSTYYHGSTHTGAIRILAEGWKTGLGAGSDVLKAASGLAVAGYPLTSTTKWAPCCGSVNAGTVPSSQHPCPLRIVLRVVGDQHNALWRRKDGQNAQHLFRPEHLHITQIYFV